MIVVDVALATICFLQGANMECHPALVGSSTPKGTFMVVQRLTDSAGYGGDVLQFHETEKEVFAIHRVWTLRPSERRLERLASSDIKQRKNITGGCINVSHEVYSKLVSCCSSSTLLIQ